MSNEQDVPHVNTPHGVGTRLQWPASGKNFRLQTFAGDIVGTVGVTPVLFETGEVRFYSESTLTTVITRSGSLK
ncbi:hypothetical protein [Microbacterium sp. Leaf179]|uniref:hypothetical protein n=1 Tax=Microbacterium sp. Leaf179 TaxID=1736288 RepID=UPI0006F5FA30|nr:hypothetical protein [Microbacterium sp. Leaf179]KQR86509.1 hypothetical protein ASF96_09090 [Microbacterium sp. Leaf179]